jgi:hypothetical protein
VAPPDPERFFERWIDEEAGLVGIERTLVFLRLSRDLGFDARLVRGTCQLPFEEAPGSSSKGRGDGAAAAHAAVLVGLGGRDVLADAGYPLPVLLPLDPAAHEIPSPWGKLSVNKEKGNENAEVVVDVDGRGAVTEAIRLERAPAEDPLPFEEWFPGGLTVFSEPSALRLHDDRVLFWSRGTMTVLDPWSRLTYPLPFSEKKTLEALLGLNLDGVDLPETVVAAAADSPAVLTVYHASPLSPDEVHRRLSLEGAPPELIASRELLVEAAAEGARIALSATLARPVPPAGPGEAVRKTLVFHLVSELLSLSR